MKKTLSIILSFSILISLLPFSFGVYAQQVDVSDEYYYAPEFLQSLCPTLPYNTDGQYSRGEFVAAVVKLLNLPASGAQSVFADVDAKHPYVSEIARGVEMGFINSQEMFYPEAPVTYSQALKIITIAIGYGERAELIGGFPAGYMKAAKEAGIGKNVDLSAEGALSYADGASLLYDMVTADVLEISSYGDEYEYSVQEGKNILSLYHDVYITEGVMEANEYTALYSSERPSGEGAFRVDGVEFKAKGFHKYIGQNVRVFYKNDSAHTTVYAYPCDNKIINTTPDHAISITGTDFEVTNPDDTSKGYKLSYDYAVIYNGKLLEAFDYNTYVNPKAGSVAVIDNDTDGSYDVIVIENIEYGVVEKVNALEDKIYDKYMKNGFIDMSGSDCAMFIYDPNGTQITLEDIGPETIVGYILSNDEKLLEVKVYDKASGGSMEEKTSDGKLIIRGNEYKLSQYYTDNIRKLDEIKLGTDVLIYLGEGNDIVYIEEVTINMKYAFVVDIMEEAGLDGEVIVKMMTSEKGMMEFKLNNKVNINGSVKSKADAKAAIEEIIAKADKYRVVKYTLNADNKVNKMYNAVDANDLSYIYDDYVDESAPKIHIDARNHYYNVGILTPYLRPSGATGMISIVPYSAALGESAEDTAANTIKHMKKDETYKTMTSANIEHQKTYNITAYDVNMAGEAMFMIVHQAQAAQNVTTQSPAAIVEKVSVVLNSEGDAYLTLRAYFGGQYKSFYVTPESPAGTDVAVSELKPGDIIRIAYKPGDIITAVARDFDGINKVVVDNANCGLDLVGYPLGRELEYINGYAYSISSSYTLVVPKDTDFTQPVSPHDAILVNLARLGAVFVKLNKDRNGNVIDASVYTEPDFSSIETWYTAGTSADYIVSRQRYREPVCNVIYVN